MTDMQCPVGSTCSSTCDRTQQGCEQIWGPETEHLEALRRNYNKVDHMALMHKWRIVKWGTRWWVVITPHGKIHGYNSQAKAMRIIDRTIKVCALRKDVDHA